MTSSPSRRSSFRTGSSCGPNRRSRDSTPRRSLRESSRRSTSRRTWRGRPPPAKGEKLEMHPVFPAIWLSTRGVWVLLAVALVIAFASVVPALVPVAAVAGATYLALLAADVALGPRAGRIRLTRKPAGFISLRHPATLRYVIENRGAVGIRPGILESPVETFAFARDTIQSAVDPHTV